VKAIAEFETYTHAVKAFVASAHLLKEWPECRRVLLTYLEEESPRNLVLPAICCTAVGGEPLDAVPVSAAWAALNLAGHLVDTVQDQDELSAEVARTPAEALSLFIGLLFLAFHFLEAVIQPATANRVHSIFTDAYFRASAGQFMGFTDYAKLPLDDGLEKYWQATILKAGNIFRAATAGGAAMGRGTEAQIAALGDYGIALGTILQILDDCRDILDESGSEIAYEVSLPILLYYSSNAQGKAQALSTNRTELMQGFEAAHVQDVIADVLANWRERALTSLQSLPPSQAVEQLAAFVDRILAQKKS
jgi:geranylgeranyl pyrophosphate synthase